MIFRAVFVYLRYFCTEFGQVSLVGYRLQVHVILTGSDVLDVRLSVLKVHDLDNGLTLNIHDDRRKPRWDFWIVSRRNAGRSGSNGKGSRRNTENCKPIGVPFRSEWMTWRDVCIRRSYPLANVRAPVYAVQSLGNNVRVFVVPVCGQLRGAGPSWFLWGGCTKYGRNEPR